MSDKNANADNPTIEMNASNEQRHEIETKCKPKGGRLSTKTVESITKLASEIAVEKYHEEMRSMAQRVYDNRYNNTKVLIQKYRLLSDYANNAVYDISRIDEGEVYEILELFGDSNAKKIKSIKDRVYTVKMIMEHIDTMLDVYKMRCTSSNKQEQQRRWRVLYSMYISSEPKTAIEAAEAENIHERTVYRDIDEACEELSTLFFGVNWAQMLSV